VVFCAGFEPPQQQTYTCSLVVRGLPVTDWLIADPQIVAGQLRQPWSSCSAFYVRS
jgi:hypothetical protein